MHAVQVGARREVRQERRVLLPHRRPVGAVHVRVVEVVAVDPPGLVEDLRPLGARVDRAPRDGVDREAALRRSIGFVRRATIDQRAVGRVEQLLARRPRRRSRRRSRQQRLVLRAWRGRSGERARSGPHRPVAAVLQVDRSARPSPACRFDDRPPARAAGRGCGVSRPSKSMRNGWSFAAAGFASGTGPSAVFFASASGLRFGSPVVAGFSSSLSCASGDAQVVAQHGEVDARRRRACRRSTARTSPCTGPASVEARKIEVLAARVEDRLAGLGQAVGDRGTTCPGRVE